MNIGTTSNKAGTPVPPEKGSFPLDHDAECKTVMKIYLDCLRKYKGSSAECRKETKEYFKCRMDQYASNVC
jgi:cytochrome c oxidase assembly protein subunit 19